jgi:hypothetical protein
VKLKSFIIAVAILLFYSFGFAQNSVLFEQIYGPITTGCIQSSVTTSGHNRSVALTIGKRYVLYGEDGAATMAGATIKCVQGTSSIDVTSIGGSRVGMIIFSGQQIVIKVSGASSQYVSCISATASQKYDLCALP